MAAKSGSNKKGGINRRRVDAGEKDRLIAELKNRIDILENELRLKDATLPENVDRRHTEDALRESEGRLQLAQQVAHIGTFEWNIQTGVDKWTPELEAMYGLQKGGFQGTYEAWEQLVHPEDRAEAARKINEAIEKGSFKGEWRVIWPDGTVHWLNGRGFVFKDETGKPLKLIGVNIDITERKRAEKELNESEDRFRALADNIPNLAWMANADGWIFWYNKQLYDYTGTTLEEIEGWGWHKIIHPDYVRAVTEEWNSRLKAGEPYDNIFPLRGKDGNYRWFLTRVTPIKDEHGKILRWFGTNTDITDRRQMEEELRKARDSLESTVEQRTAKLQESEEKFRALADNIPNLAWMADSDGRIFWFNKQWYDYTGTTLEEVRGWGWLKVHHPDYAQKVKENWLSSIESGQPHENVAFLRGKDGNYRWFLTRVTPIRDERGNICRWFGTNTDITERKRAEEALHESENKFRAMFEGAGPAIFIADVATGCITDCNWKAEELTGRSRDELVGLHQTQLHPADKAGVQREQFARHAKGIVFNKDEAEVLHRDGRVIPVIINAAPLKVNGRDIMIGFFFDITERKQAEEALGKNLAVLAKSQEIAHLGSWTVDFDTGRFELSDEMYRIHGFEPGTVEPTRDLSLKLTHPDDVKRYREFDESMRREGRLGCIEYRIVRPDGSVRYVYVQTDSVVRGLDGRVKTASGVTQDVTERKRAEEALKEAKAQAELYLDLMGHDINNMHQIAMGYLEIAQELIPMDEVQKELLYKPVEVLQRSARLIQNVQKLQKINKGVFQSKDVDVCQMLVDVQRELGSVPHKALTLNLNGCDRCAVRANDLLHDVFTNLVSNSIKHTGDRADIHIGLDLVNDNGGRHCRVSVEDNGPGISDGNKPTIFNRGLKGTEGMKKAKGMGLGLYLVKSLVESYGGKVWVEDRVAGDHTKGARFVVMLPAVENH